MGRKSWLLAKAHRARCLALWVNFDLEGVCVCGYFAVGKCKVMVCGRAHLEAE